MKFWWLGCHERVNSHLAAHEFMKNQIFCLKCFDNRQSELEIEYINRKLLNSWNYFMNSSKREADQIPGLYTLFPHIVSAETILF